MIEQDPNYKWVPPLPAGMENQVAPKGRQCGECGMKFDSENFMALHCPSKRCPMGWSMSRIT